MAVWPLRPNCLLPHGSKLPKQEQKRGPEREAAKAEIRGKGQKQGPERELNKNKGGD